MELIKNKLEELGAPKGSKLILTETKQEIPFGKKEGLAIYLDQDVLDEDLSLYNSEEIISKLASLINAPAEGQRFMELKNNKTVLYFYKDSYEEMKNAVAEYVNSYPLKKYFQIVKIT